MGGKEHDFGKVKRVAFSTEIYLKRSDYGFDKNAIGPIGDEALIMIDCEGSAKIGCYHDSRGGVRGTKQSISFAVAACRTLNNNLARALPDA